MNCENCGIPDDAYAHPGYKLRLAFAVGQDESWIKRRRARSVVWVCGPDCAVQTMAIAAMGLPTYKWPISLREFTARMNAAGKLEFLKGQASETYSKKRENIEVHEPLEMTSEEMQAGTFKGVFLTPEGGRTGGRPKSGHPSKATLRQRRYENGKKSVE